MPLGVFKGFFKDKQREPLGEKLAGVYRMKASMQASGFAGSQISRNWRDLVEAEARLKKEQATRHWAALKLAEDGQYDASLAAHRANFEDRFHVADTYEVLAMAAQRDGDYASAIAIMDEGCRVFRELVPADAPQRQRTLGFMERRRERLQRRQAEAAHAG